MIIFLVLLLIGILFGAWLWGVIKFTDYFPCELNIEKFKKILVLIPHPDDEVLTCGGLLRKASRMGISTTVAMLTMGERGQEGALYDEKLKKVRQAEAHEVAKILRVKKLIMKDLGDNELSKKQEMVRREAENIIAQEKPDLIITYDQSGLYGHPDHIIVSKIITELIKTKFKKIKLYYLSFPKKYYKFIKLPIHMATNPEFLKNRRFPTCKLFVGTDAVVKTRALYAYRSQLFAFRKSVPRFVPLWFVLSTRLFEYYHEVN